MEDDEVLYAVPSELSFKRWEAANSSLKKRVILKNDGSDHQIFLLSNPLTSCFRMQPCPLDPDHTTSSCHVSRTGPGLVDGESLHNYNCSIQTSFCSRNPCKTTHTTEHHVTCAHMPQVTSAISPLPATSCS